MSTILLQGSLSVSRVKPWSEFPSHTTRLGHSVCAGQDFPLPFNPGRDRFCLVNMHMVVAEYSSLGVGGCMVVGEYSSFRVGGHKCAFPLPHALAIMHVDVVRMQVQVQHASGTPVSSRSV